MGTRTFSITMAPAEGRLGPLERRRLSPLGVSRGVHLQRRRVIPDDCTDDRRPAAHRQPEPVRADRSGDHRLGIRRPDGGDQRYGRRDGRHRTSRTATTSRSGASISEPGATSFDARVASNTSGGSIELHLDSLEQHEDRNLRRLGNRRRADLEDAASCTVTSTTGVHDLFLSFTGGSGDLFNFNWWRFDGPGANDQSDAGAVDGSAPDGDNDGVDGGSSSAGGTSDGSSGYGGALSGSSSGNGGSGASGAGSSNGGSTTGMEGAAKGGGCSCRVAVDRRVGASAVLALMALGALRWRRRVRRGTSHDG